MKDLFKFKTPPLALSVMFPAILMLPFAAVIFILLYHGVPDFANSGDGALLEMSTRNLFSRGILTGAYSRFGFFHPGPLYFAVRFPLYYLFGMKAASFIITSALIGMASLTGAYLIIRRYAGAACSLIFSLLTAYFLYTIGPETWLSEWNPVIILLPLYFLVILSAAICIGHHKFLPVAVVVGSFAAQTHIGSIPSLCIICLLISVMYFYPSLFLRSETSRNSKGFRSLLVSLLILLVLWLPVIYEEISAHDSGNIRSIRAFMLNTPPDQEFAGTLSDWSFAVTHYEMRPIARFLKVNELEEVYQYTVIILRTILLVFVWLWMRRKKNSSFISALCLLTLVLYFTTLASAWLIRGERHDYLFIWMKFISPLSWIVIFTSFTEMISASVSIRAKKTATIITAALLIAMSGMNTVAGMRYLRSGSPPLWRLDRVVSAMIEPLSAFLSSHSGYNTVIELQDNSLWPVVTGLVNSLEKRGFTVDWPQSEFFIKYNVAPLEEDRPELRIYLRGAVPDGPEDSGAITSCDGFVIGI